MLLAQAGPPTDGYEDRLVQWALDAQEREREPMPEGKRIEEIIIASENIFAPSDPWPTILNIFHAKTREAVIAREVLLAPGDTWTADRVAETERNLRRLFILAVARVVPVQGRDGGVGALIVTKDRWSLRLNSDFVLIGSLLQYLRLQPTEMNFRGMNQQVTIDTILRLDTFQVAETFVEQRLLGTRMTVGESAALVFNRQTGRVEGTTGGVAFGLPLVTLDQKWGFDISGSWNVRTRRTFRGASVWLLPYPDDTGPPTVPYMYAVQVLNAEASVTRSWGSKFKADATAAVGAYQHQYAPLASASLTDEQRTWFIASYLPRSENATYLSGFFRAYTADFRVLHDINIYQLSEDFQVGPLFQAGVRWALPPPLATAGFVELGAAIRYRLYRADDVLTVSVAGATRLRPGESPVNQRLAAEVINYTPPLQGGRFVARVLVELTANDLDNRHFLLGGSSGLRGTYPEAFSGRNMVLGNIEYRMKPFEAWTNQVGLVVFYDVGSAFDVRPVLTHTVGFGLRILLPQFNQEVIRLDFGIVLGSDQPPGLDRFNATYGQVTDLRPTFLDQPL